VKFPFYTYERINILSLHHISLKEVHFLLNSPYATIYVLQSYLFLWSFMVYYILLNLYRFSRNTI